MAYICDGVDVGGIWCLCVEPWPFCVGMGGLGTVVGGLSVASVVAVPLGGMCEAGWGGEVGSRVWVGVPRRASVGASRTRVGSWVVGVGGTSMCLSRAMGVLGRRGVGGVGM